MPKTRLGEVYIELYLSDPEPGRHIGLYRSGTRILPDLTQLEFFQRFPWNSEYLEGILDVPFLTLTPGTRSGIVQDETFSAFCASLVPLEEDLAAQVREQERAEQERAARNVLRTIQKAFREALLALPAEEYDWFEVHAARRTSLRGELGRVAEPDAIQPLAMPEESLAKEGNGQRRFFEFAGPLFSVQIAPASAIVAVEHTKNFRAIARDRGGRLVEQDVSFSWEIVEGSGRFENTTGEIVTFVAPSDPGLMRIQVTAVQGSIECQHEALNSGGNAASAGRANDL